MLVLQGLELQVWCGVCTTDHRGIERISQGSVSRANTQEEGEVVGTDKKERKNPDKYKLLMTVLMCYTKIAYYSHGWKLKIET